MGSLDDKSSKAWQVVTWGVISYEILCYLSKERIPLLTTVMRSLPKVGKLAAVAVIGLAFYDHFESRRFF